MPKGNFKVFRMNDFMKMEQELNTWLAENPEVVVRAIGEGVASGWLFVTVYYEVKEASTKEGA